MRHALLALAIAFILSSPGLCETPDKVLQTRINASIVTQSFDQTAQQLNALAGQHNAVINNMGLDANNSTGSAYLKIPPARLDSFLSELSTLGTIENQNLSTSDNTRSYQDTLNRLRAFERLAQVDTKTMTASANLSAEERLVLRAEFDNYVRNQIQSYRSSLDSYKDYSNWVEISLNFRKPQQAQDNPNTASQAVQQDKAESQPPSAPASSGKELMPVYALVLFNLLGLWAVHRRLDR